MGLQKRRRSLVLMYLATCLMWFSIYFYVPILSPYSEEMGASYTMVGTILSSYGLVQLICRLPIGIFSDRLNKRKIFLIVGMLSAAASGLGFFFASTPEQLLVFRALAGLSASTWAIFMISFNSYYTPEQQSKSMGIISTSMFVGQVIATFFGGIVASVIDEKWTFFVSAIASAAGVILLLLSPEPPTEEREPPRIRDFLSLFKDKDLIFFSLMAVIMQIGSYTGALGFIPNVLRDMGASNFILGLCTALSMLPAIATSYLSGSFFEKRFGAKASLIGSFVLFALTLIGMVVAKNVWYILLLVFLSGIPKGLMQPMLNSLAIKNVRPEVKSAAASLFQSIYGLGMTLGPIIAGAIADAFGMTAAFVIVGFLTLSAVIFIGFKKMEPRGQTT